MVFSGRRHQCRPLIYVYRIIVVCVTLAFMISVCMNIGWGLMNMFGAAHRMLLSDLYQVGPDDGRGPLYVWYVVFWRNH